MTRMFGARLLVAMGVTDIDDKIINTGSCLSALNAEGNAMLTLTSRTVFADLMYSCSKQGVTHRVS